MEDKGGNKMKEEKREKISCLEEEIKKRENASYWQGFSVGWLVGVAFGIIIMAVLA